MSSQDRPRAGSSLTARAQCPRFASWQPLCAHGRKGSARDDVRADPLACPTSPYVVFDVLADADTHVRDRRTGLNALPCDVA